MALVDQCNNRSCYSHSVLDVAQTGGKVCWSGNQSAPEKAETIQGYLQTNKASASGRGIAVFLGDLFSFKLPFSGTFFIYLCASLLFYVPGGRKGSGDSAWEQIPELQTKDRYVFSEN